MSSILKPLLAASAALALGACATTPQPLQGNYAQIDPGQAAPSAAAGTAVRWGGQIIKTEPQAQKTCFFMLAHPLDNVARPRVDANSAGRFIACHSGFYDPEVFTKGREVTFTGTLNGHVTRKVGEYNYNYPRVDASTVYLWPKPRPVTAYRDPFYSPFYDPFWGGFYGPGFNPYWNQPRVIIIRRPHPHPHPHPKPGK